MCPPGTHRQKVQQRNPDGMLTGLGFACDFRFGFLFAKCRPKTEISHNPKSNLICSHTMKETFLMVSITFHMHLKQWYIAEHKSKIRE